MKNSHLKSFMAFISILVTSSVSAQLVLPQQSPKSSVMQTVGLTEITIDYSSPAVKGRAIWGELVPYDKVWRAGANSATKITFSKDVTINNVLVPKGSYSILMFPDRIEWTVMINKDASVSAEAYNEEMNITKFKVLPYTLPSAAVVTSSASNMITERLTYSFSDFTNEMTKINMLWEKIRISFQVNVDTEKQSTENIERATNGIWGIYNNAARYYFDKKEYDKALGYANQSIASSDLWFNNWVKAQILSAKGLNSEAYTHAAKAKEIGDRLPAGNFFFKAEVEKALVDWAAFAPKQNKKGK